MNRQNNKFFSNHLLFYSLFVGISLLLMWLVVVSGANIPETTTTPAATPTDASAWAVFVDGLSHNLGHPLALMLLQVIIIMTLARAFGSLANKLRQPVVIGEIFAGIFLGPSLLGLLFPSAMASIFPASSLGLLQNLSQLGLVLFMFIVGMELDFKVLKNKANAAVVISHVSIIFPYLLGMLLALFLYREFGADRTSFLAFSLFMGIAMSITAFPVLARIVQERGLTKTSLGALVITCAAADDITAWCLLAVVIAIVKAGSLASAGFTIVLALGFVVFMIYLVRPFLARFGRIYDSRETIDKTALVIVLFTLFGAAYATEVIGIHALFGAFMAGTMMPQKLSFKQHIADKVEDVSLVVLLPLFFAFTGLRTQIGLLNSGHLWLVCGMVVLVAIVGKFGGSALAARFMGQNWKDSLSIGVLMNTRGLMELVVLNIGYDMGILSDEIFAMMVLMALLTTVLTGPALDLIERLFDTKSFGERIATKINGTLSILISFGNPKTGSSLLRLADTLTYRFNPEVNFTAFHITPNTELTHQEAILYEKEAFKSIKGTAQLLGLKMNTIYKNTSNVEKEIARVVNDQNYDLILFGAARPLFSNNMVGGKLDHFLSNEYTNVGILIDKGSLSPKNVLWPVLNDSDKPLMQYTDRFAANSRSHIDVLPIGNLEICDLAFDNLVSQDYRYLKGSKAAGEGIKNLTKAFLSHYDLVVVKLETWQVLTNYILIEDFPSVLIIKYVKELSDHSLKNEAREVAEKN